MCFLKKKKKKTKEQIPELPKFIEGEEINAFEAEVIGFIIEHRFDKKLKMIRANTMLNRIATIHSKDMAKKKQASHDGFPERDYKCRVYTKANKVMEIVAGGYGTAHGVMGKEPIIDEYGKIIEEGTGWLGSEKHKKVIEWKEATHYGISIEKGADNRYYYTVLFIEK